MRDSISLPAPFTAGDSGVPATYSLRVKLMLLMCSPSESSLVLLTGDRWLLPPVAGLGLMLSLCLMAGKWLLTSSEVDVGVQGAI